MSDPIVARERELLERTEVYQQILDAIADMVLVKGAESRILWANKAFRDYYGMTNAQLRDLIDATFNQVDYTEQYVRDDRYVYTTGQVLDIPEEPVTRHDGLVQIFHTVKSPIRDEDGRVLMTVGVSRNITEPMRVKQDLVRYREHLERLVAERTNQLSRLSTNLSTILTSLVEGIVAVDAERRVQLVNPAAERLLGWSWDDATGKDVHALLDFAPEHEEDEPPGTPSPGVLLSRARPTVGHLHSRRGAVHLVSIQAAPLKDDDGRATGTVLVLRDVGLEREATNQRLRYQKLESLGQLAGGIAHDFNNLLAGILGSISIARVEGARGQSADQLLEQAEQACLRAQGLTKQLLTFARGGAPVKRPMAVLRPVREAAELALLGSGCSLALTADADVSPIDADEGQVVQVIGNLVMNARQAMPSGGQVTIHIENFAVAASPQLPLAPGNYVRIAVRDHGCGIAPEHLHRIFDPYFTTKAAGSGLGLASVHSIVSQHGGHVDVSSRPGAGSEFSVYLPVAVAEPSVAENVRVTGTPGKRQRILVLDDDPGVRGVMTAVLALLGHDAVVVGNSGKAFEAFEHAQRDQAPFDAAFIDLTMPGDLPGLEVIERLVESNTGTKLIVMSGYSTDPILANYRDHGLAACLQKPFTVAQVEAVLK